MSDLIDRQLVIDGLSELVSRLKFVQGDLGGAVSGVREYIKTLPSVEPERKKGKWIVHLYSLGMDRYECSECEERCNLGYHFCPNCGTEMVGGYGKND